MQNSVVTTNNKIWPSMCFLDIITYFCIMRYATVSKMKYHYNNFKWTKIVLKVDIFKKKNLIVKVVIQLQDYLLF